MFAKFFKKNLFLKQGKPKTKKNKYKWFQSFSK